MAKRTINSPGVEIRERDLSLRVPTTAGTNVYVAGFSDQGPFDEVLDVTSLTEFENIYGTPKTPAERYFYHTVKSTLNSTVRLKVNRIPYGSGSGQGFGSFYSVLGYPVTAVGSSTLDTTSGAYLVGRPTQFTTDQTGYQALVDGSLFTNGWSTTAATSFNSLQSLSGAGIIVINKAQTVIDGKFNGYYIGISDNTNINPASNYDAILQAATTTSTPGAAGSSSYINIPSTRLAFTLTATPAFGNNPAVNSISQVMEEKITNYDTSTREFDDTLSVGIFKLRQSVFSNDANELDYLLEEGYNGSIGYYRQINSEVGGPPVNFFLENLENDSRNIDILVNPYMSDVFGGIRLNNDGTPSKKIRVITNQLRNSLASTLSASVSAIAGCSFSQLTAAGNSLGYADSLYPLGAYGETKLNQKDIGNLPAKLTRALDRIRNDEVFDIDVVAEGGLGTIWTTVCSTSLNYFDDTKTSTDINALRTSNDLTNTAARDYYTTIANQFITFCGPIKDGGRGDILFVADPIRQILVTGKQSKVIDDPTKNFSQDIYWAMRHQFENINTSYATVYGNYMKVYDDYSGLYIFVPPSGFVAAKLASTDADVGPWAAPAGFNRGIITDAIDLAIAPNQRQRDELYKVNINPITRFPDQGLVVFGQKTMLKKPSAFDRVNVRRTFLYLEKVTKQVMKFFLFENNTLFTRTRVINTLVPFFERVKASDGLYDYLIVCDERNNTPEVIDSNELVVDIYLKPVRTAEYILVNFYATRTDTNFEELVGG
jgi:hypothetical protein